MAKKRVAVSLRNPPSPEAVEQFVHAGEEQPEPEVTAPVSRRTDTAPRAKPAPRRKAPAKAAQASSPLVAPDGTVLYPVNVLLPEEVWQRLSVHCVSIDRDMSRVIADALEQHLAPQLGTGSEPCEEERFHAGWQPPASAPKGIPTSAAELWERVEPYVKAGHAFATWLRGKASYAF